MAMQSKKTFLLVSVGCEQPQVLSLCRETRKNSQPCTSPTVTDCVTLLHEGQMTCEAIEGHALNNVRLKCVISVRLTTDGGLWYTVTLLECTYSYICI